MIGQTISHYKILDKLGEGGMGVVYKALDTKLDRIVALKFLPMSVMRSPEEIARFQQEAKTISALNHTNIATIYDFDEVGGQKFLAFEFIEGGTLKRRVQDNPHGLPIAEVMNYAIQIAEGLAHAHHHRIIHRDVKTENIMLTEDGKVKITDFGLAKFQGSTQLTQAGLSVGTAAYMSPEQVRGEELDFRSDLFSFGVVVYELLTGNLPFRGEHHAAIGYSIVNESPTSMTSFRRDIPSPLEHLILRCLNKERDQRFQTADEIVTELIKIQQELAGTPHISVRSARWFIPVTSFFVIGAVVGAYILLRSQRPEGPSRAINVSLKQLTFAGGVEEYPNWSPDGSMIAFSGEVGGFKKIFTKQLATGEETQLTKGASDDIQPSWTSDANTILFVRSHQANGKLEPGDIFGQYDGGDIWSIDVRSGKESKIIENAFNPSPRPDGQSIAFDASLSGARRIWIADNRGRNPRQITTDSSEAVAHIMPRWSPDGANIVFQNMERTTFDLKAVNVSSGKMTWITNDLFRDIGPVWAPSGKKIYFTSDRGGGLNIWRVTVSPEGIRSGQPEQITTGAGQDVDIAISPDGKNLAYSVLKLNADIWELPVAPNSGKALGEPQRVIATTREDSRGAWSHDGTMIAFNSDRTGEMNIWLYSLRDGAVRQLTKGSGGDFQPNWSPDGKTIVFFSSRSGNADIWSANVASGELIQLTKSSALEINPFYSPDGNLIAFQSDAGGRLEPWSMKSDGTDQHSMANMEVSGHFMRWLQGGKALVFRSPNPTQPGLWTVSPSGGEPSYLISPKGGAHTSFSPGFDLIMDVVGHKEMWVSSLTGKAPEKVFEFSDPEIRIDYPVWSPDGKWILFDWVKPQGGDIWLMENID